jgi:type IV secretory pathway VirD2 relaxase
LLGRMEADLDTRLDWVAVNHHDTDHPHVHLIIRGVDEDGQRLYIRNDYLRDGIRFQAQDLATRELGWRQELTHEHALTPTHALSPAHTPNRGTDIGRHDDLGIGF